MSGLLQGLTVSGMACGVLVFVGASPSWAQSVNPWHKGGHDGVVRHDNGKHDGKKQQGYDRDKPKYTVKAAYGGHGDKDKGYEGKGGHHYGHYVAPAHKPYDKPDKPDKPEHRHDKHKADRGHDHGTGHQYGGSTASYDASYDNYARISYVAALTEKASYETRYSNDLSYGFDNAGKKHGYGHGDSKYGGYGGHGQSSQTAAVRASYERSAFFSYQAEVSQSAAVSFASGQHGYGHAGWANNYLNVNNYARVAAVSAAYEKSSYQADYSRHDGYTYGHGKHGGTYNVRNAADYSQKASYERSQYVAYSEERSERYKSGYSADHAGYGKHGGYDKKRSHGDGDDGYKHRDKSHDRSDDKKDDKKYAKHDRKDDRKEDKKDVTYAHKDRRDDDRDDKKRHGYDDGKYEKKHDDKRDDNEKKHNAKHDDNGKKHADNDGDAHHDKDDNASKHERHDQHDQHDKHKDSHNDGDNDKHGEDKDDKHSDDKKHDWDKDGEHAEDKHYAKTWQ